MKSNSSFYSISMSKHAQAAEQAEFSFTVNEDNDYEFTSLIRNGRYDSIGQDYQNIDIAANVTSPWQQRHKWKVGVAKDGIHWGVYISRQGTEKSDKPDSETRNYAAPQIIPPVDIYKVYGVNWSGNSNPAIHLQAVWKSGSKLMRDLQRSEIQTVSKKDNPVMFVESVWDEKEMYFSWPEFVLVAQFFLQEYVIKLSKEDTTKLLARERLKKVQKYNTAKAYSLMNNNCRHFSGDLIKQMMRNRWTDESRLREKFLFKELASEWRTHNNIWATGTIHSLKPRVGSRAKSKAQHTTRPYAAGTTAFNLESLRNELPLMSRIHWSKLNAGLHQDPDALAIAVAFINNKKCSIENILRLLEDKSTINSMPVILEEYTNTSTYPPSHDLLGIWIVVFKSIWQGADNLFRLLQFLSCTTGYRVHRELLPKSGSLGTDIDTLRRLRILQQGDADYVTVHRFLWDIMIFTMAKWEACVEASTMTSQNDPKSKAAKIAIGHIHDVAKAYPKQGKAWWDRNGLQVREILRDWQEDHNQYTEETYMINQFIGRNLLEHGSAEEAIEYLKFTERATQANTRQPAIHLEAQLELARALRSNNLQRPEFQQIQQMLDDNPKLNHYLTRKKSGVVESNVGEFWLDSWKFVPELCLEKANAYKNLGKPAKACEILNLLIQQLDNDFPLSDKKLRSKFASKINDLKIKAQGEKSLKDKADLLYRTVQDRLSVVFAEKTVDSPATPQYTPTQSTATLLETNQSSTRHSLGNGDINGSYYNNPYNDPYNRYN